MAEYVEKGLQKAGITISKPVLAVICIIFGILVILFPSLLVAIVGLFLVIQGTLLLIEFYELGAQPTSQAKPSGIYCSNCGKRHKEEAAYCTKCGKPIKRPQLPTIEPAGKKEQ
jgi:uncharacterized paraquat-inducible protein A